MRWLWLLAPLAQACSRGTATVDEGCRPPLHGASSLNGSPAVLERVDCYRNYLGLPPLSVSRRVQDAAEAHASWLEANDVLGPSATVDVRDANGIVTEVPGTDAFYGRLPYDRNVEAGVIPSGSPATTIWPLFRFQAAVDADKWIMEPGVRDAMFQPQILGVGEATVTLDGVERAYTDVHAALPAGTRLLRPVVYPKDGQQDVPAAWTSLWQVWWDGFANHATVGFPITITMDCDSQSIIPNNPFRLKVESAALTDADGKEVPIRVITPTGTYATILRTTVVLVPEAPLAEDTEYAVDAEITSLFGSTVIHTTFRTASAGADTDVPDTGGNDTDAP